MVVETGKDVKKIKVGDRVVVTLHDRLRAMLVFVLNSSFSLCDNSNSECGCGQISHGTIASWAVWVFAHVRRGLPAARQST